MWFSAQFKKAGERFILFCSTRDVFRETLSVAWRRDAAAIQNVVKARWLSVRIYRAWHMSNFSARPIIRQSQRIRHVFHETLWDSPGSATPHTKKKKKNNNKKKKKNFSRKFNDSADIEAKAKKKKLRIIRQFVAHANIYMKRSMEWGDKKKIFNFQAIELFMWKEKKIVKRKKERGKETEKKVEFKELWEMTRMNDRK